jgi:hypothetical protein
MAHIANFMVDNDAPNSVGLNNYIAREVSPAPSHDAVCPPIVSLGAGFSNILTDIGKFSAGGEGEARLENASTIRVTETSPLPFEGKAIDRSRSKEPR